jgi:hypothetical protein
MARITGAVDTMPIFTPSTRMSENTASIWASTTSGSMFWMAVTPVVFWAVTAVITLMP